MEAIPKANLPVLTMSIAFLLALAIPVVLILIRNNVRQQRGDVVAEFEKVFDMERGKDASFEFVKNKYRGPDSFSWWKLYLAAVPFMMISFLGISLAFIPLKETALIKGVGTVHHHVAPTLLTNGGSGALDGQYFENFLTVAVIAFIASFLFALRYLVRSIANFDLAPLTFFRVTLHMLLAIATAGVLWRTFPSLSESLFGSAAAAATTASLLWIGAAFMIGFFPDLGMNYLIQRIPFPLKRGRDDLLGQCAVTSIEVVDGIDIWKRFRLEEIDIVDVQNLAATNPILLHVETPYGFYECFDWVAQAQLCTIVGADQFLELRRCHIRTVFDLERAVLGPQATEQARRMVADVLYARGPETGKFFEKWQRGAPAEQAEAATPSVPHLPYDDATFKHLVQTMLDDLHVHRLRQTWIHTAEKLGARSASLDPLYQLEHGANVPAQVSQQIVVQADGEHKPNGGEPKPNGGDLHA